MATLKFSERTNTRMSMYMDKKEIKIYVIYIWKSALVADTTKILKL